MTIKSFSSLIFLEFKAGVVIGIPSSKSAFITAMYVPLVPVLQWICLRRIPGLMSWIGVVLAFAGLLLLAGPEGTGLTLGTGEIITLIGAIAIAAEIILTSAFAGRVDIKRVTVVQLATASIIAFATMIPAGESLPPLSHQLAIVALGLGVFSAIIQVTMNWAQRSVSPTRATLIYTGEPVWVGVFGRMAWH